MEEEEEDWRVAAAAPAGVGARARRPTDGRRLSVETALNVGRRLRLDQLLRRGGPYHRHASNWESKLL